MDIFQWFENLRNPLVTPTADLATEALRKYQAGEIDLATYQATVNRAKEIESGIQDALSDYEKVVDEKYSLDPASIVAPVTDLSKNLMALLLVAGALYLLTQWRRLES